MKAFVAIVVFVLCAVQIVFGLSNLESLRIAIAKQKTSVQSTVNRLQRHQRDFSFNLGNKLSNAKISSMQEINSIVNPTLEKIEDATKKSTTEGKDATHCYEAARAKLREYSLNGFDDLEGCRNKALSSVSLVKDNVDSTILSGQQVTSHLDSIFPSCFSTNSQQTEFCVAGKLPEATQMVRSLEATADAVISSANSAASDAQTNAVNCNRGPVSNVREGAASAQLDANQCIASL